MSKPSNNTDELLFEFIREEWGEPILQKFQTQAVSNLSVDEKLIILDGIILQRSPQTRIPFIPTRMTGGTAGQRIRKSTK